MGISTVEERLAELEHRLQEMEERLALRDNKPTEKRGWRAIVGVHADNPRFEEAMRLGREWRFADSPKGDGEDE